MSYEYNKIHLAKIQHIDLIISELQIGGGDEIRDIEELYYNISVSTYPQH